MFTFVLVFMILYYSGPYSDVLGNYYCGQYKLDIRLIPPEVHVSLDTT